MDLLFTILRPFGFCRWRRRIVPELELAVLRLEDSQRYCILTFDLSYVVGPVGLNSSIDKLRPYWFSGFEKFGTGSSQNQVSIPIPSETHYVSKPAIQLDCWDIKSELSLKHPEKLKSEAFSAILVLNNQSMTHKNQRQNRRLNKLVNNGCCSRD